MTAVTDRGTVTGDALRGVGRAMVIGLGVSGRAAADALNAAGVTVTVVDAAIDHPAADEVRARGVEVLLGVDPAELVDRVELVVPSPGVPEHTPALVAAQAAGIPVWSEPELGWRLHPRALVGVTGTNGKTSTTELVAAMVAAGGRATVACGNIGMPLTVAAAASGPDDLLVVELSSFQLRFAGTLRPRVGVLLNLAADHLDWHPDVAAYGRAKARLWEAQRPADWAVANRDDPTTLRLRDDHAPGGRAAFSASGRVEVGVGRVGDELVADGPAGSALAAGPVVALGDLLGGAAAPYQVANVAAAACAALLVGTPVDAVRDAAASFRPGRHRHEVVARRDDGVVFVDDSKATNVHAAAAALATGGPLVWIAGGRAKAADLGPLADELAAVHDAVLLGEAADELVEVCGRAGVPAHRAATIEEAVGIAARLAAPGDTVLLAPACASFDQFRDYAERGDRFAAAARRAAGRPQPPGEEGDRDRG
jgi:UDP-N-acetylmuramoylalanine--D-glutamate ligase